MKIKKHHVIIAVVGYGLMALLFFYDYQQDVQYFNEVRSEFPALTKEDEVRSSIKEVKTLNPKYRDRPDMAYLALDNGDKYFVYVGLELKRGINLTDLPLKSMLFCKNGGSDTIEFRNTWEDSSASRRFILKRNK